MTDDEVRQEVQRNGWADARSTGKTYNDYTIYKCVSKHSPGVYMDTGLPSYILVKDDDIRGPQNDDEWEAIDDIVRGKPGLNMEDFDDDEEP